MIGRLNSPLVAVLQNGEPGKPVAAQPKKVKTSDRERLTGSSHQAGSLKPLEFAAFKYTLKGSRIQSLGSTGSNGEK